MDDIVESDADKQKEMFNKIIAAGLNSMNFSGSEEGIRTLELFIKSDFKIILPCWDYLNDKVKFQIFSIHKDDFKKYMESVHVVTANLKS